MGSIAANLTRQTLLSLTKTLSNRRPLNGLLSVASQRRALQCWASTRLPEYPPPRFGPRRDKTSSRKVASMQNLGLLVMHGARRGGIEMLPVIHLLPLWK